MYLLTFYFEHLYMIVWNSKIYKITKKMQEGLSNQQILNIIYKFSWDRRYNKAGMSPDKLGPGYHWGRSRLPEEQYNTKQSHKERSTKKT